jgi:hypothetical protein
VSDNIISIGALALIPQPLRTFIQQALDRRDREILELRQRVADLEERLASTSGD